MNVRESLSRINSGPFIGLFVVSIFYFLFGLLRRINGSLKNILIIIILPQKYKLKYNYSLFRQRIEQYKAKLMGRNFGNKSVFSILKCFSAALIMSLWDEG